MSLTRLPRTDLESPMLEQYRVESRIIIQLAVVPENFVSMLGRFWRSMVALRKASWKPLMISECIGAFLVIFPGRVYAK